MGADAYVVQLLHSDHRVLDVLRDYEKVVNAIMACRELGGHDDATNKGQPASGIKLGRRHVEVASYDPGTLECAKAGPKFLE